MEKETCINCHCFQEVEGSQFGRCGLTKKKLKGSHQECNFFITKMKERHWRKARLYTTYNHKSIELRLKPEKEIIKIKLTSYTKDIKTLRDIQKSVEVHLLRRDALTLADYLREWVEKDDG